jgi:hypothetical protein
VHALVWFRDAEFCARQMPRRVVNDSTTSVLFVAGRSERVGRDRGVLTALPALLDIQAAGPLPFAGSGLACRLHGLTDVRSQPRFHARVSSSGTQM